MPTIVPKRQPKKQTQEARQKQLKTTKQIKEIKEGNIKELNNIKNEIFEQTKQKLPEILVNKVNNIIEEIANLSTVDGLSETQIFPLISSRSTNFYVSSTYSADELFVLFNEYVRMIAEINKKTIYLPTKKNFCAFAGITSATYNNYLVDFDENKRSVVQMIDDYITDVNLSCAQNGKVREITTIFRSKAEYGMIEAQAPVVIEYKKALNFDEVKKKLESFGKVYEADIIEEKETN